MSVPFTPPASVLAEVESRGHEKVHFFKNEKSDTLAIIAVHNTKIGPSLGGCRMRDYSSLESALADVLNLSHAMSYKNSLCGINFGGGKSVIVAPRDLSQGRDELFRWFGDCVQAVGGTYITAEDMGTSVSDMSFVSKGTAHVAGTDPNAGGGGDPSPWTALGVYHGMKACAEHCFGSEDLSGKRVAIQGVGNVGYNLAKLLAEEGAELVVYDTREDVLRQSVEEFGAKVSENILLEECDFLSPCAAGGAITEEVAQKLNCKVVAGGANNQIVSDAEAKLMAKGIVYAPDFAINAGGVILCADEFEEGGFTESRVRERVEKISSTISKILSLSKDSPKSAGEIAVQLATERINSA